MNGPPEPSPKLLLGAIDELRRTGEHVALFNEIAKALTSTLEPREVLRVIIQQVSSVLRPMAWALLLHDEVTGELYFEIAMGPGGEQLRGERVPCTAGVAGVAFTTGQAQLVNRVELEEERRRFELLARTPPRDVMALPLRAHGRVLGVLVLVNGVDRPMRRDALHSVKAIADYAAIAIENARNFRRVQELTITDDHTGLFNARHLRERLEAEVARALRFSHPLSLVFLDLDRFKEVNDTHGHLAGSALLAEVGAVLARTIRKVDVAFRYGGDEFALMLVETDAAGARIAGKRVQEALVSHTFLTDHGLAVRITASIGVATLPDDAHTGEELLDLADQAMYRAKALGRNEVVATGDLALVEPEALVRPAAM